MRRSAATCGAHFAKLGTIGCCLVTPISVGSGPQKRVHHLQISDNFSWQRPSILIAASGPNYHEQSVNS